ncbi:MAG: SDR family NAD(P)-dependent oxidoreductase [Acidobacteriota bacterium]
MTLAGKVAMLTGVKRIGAVVAERLAQGGADVSLVYNRSSEEAEATATAVRRMGRRAITLQANLEHADDCRRIVRDTLAELGRLDVLVTMAGLYTSTPFAQLTAAQWDAQMNVDLRSAFLCAQAAVPAMRQAGGGRMIFFSDWLTASGRPRYPGYVGYYVAKAGVKALAEAMALELAKDQILVNAVAPGPIVAPPGSSDEEQKAVAASTPLGRWGGEAEIAKAVMFLVETDFVTGETVRVDGGRHLK